jgi:hypothetical protein
VRAIDRYRVYVSLYFGTQLSLSIRSFLDDWRSGVEPRPYNNNYVAELLEHNCNVKQILALLKTEKKFEAD